MEQRDVTGGGRDSPSGIVHHVAAPVERHLRLVLWIVWRVVIVAGVVELVTNTGRVPRHVCPRWWGGGCLTFNMLNGMERMNGCHGCIFVRETSDTLKDFGGSILS